MSLAHELVAEIVAGVARDPELARALADALAPHLGGAAGGWATSGGAVIHLGLDSPDALDRLVRKGLPYSQPHGPGGRRYFHLPKLDAWMEEHG